MMTIGPASVNSVKSSDSTELAEAVPIGMMTSRGLPT